MNTIDIISKFNDEMGILSSQPEENIEVSLKLRGKASACLRFLKSLGILSGETESQVLKRIINRGVYKEFELQYKNAIKHGKMI